MATPSAPAASTPPALGTGRTALGVRTVPIDGATQSRFQLPQPAGAYVIGVVQDLPAAKAGVPPGSVIVALGEQPVRSPEELTKLVASGPLDRPVTVQFVLPGGAAKQAAVVLQALDEPLERALTGAGTAAVPPPTLQPAPRRAERPTVDESAIRTEVRALRGMLDRLERLLDPASRRRP
ncbi:MAG: PDZ domain-containing protein [Planctomycetaceae bacterium]